jgi:hypothetical protein
MASIMLTCIRNAIKQLFPKQIFKNQKLKKMNASKIFKSFSVIALGIFIALLATVLPAQAQDGDLENPGEGGDGTCAPWTGYVCGLNGQNYVDKYLEKR